MSKEALDVEASEEDVEEAGDDAGEEE